MMKLRRKLFKMCSILRELAKVKKRERERKKKTEANFTHLIPYHLSEALNLTAQLHGTMQVNGLQPHIINSLQL